MSTVISIFLPNEMHQPTRHKGQNENRARLMRGRLDAFVKH